jgi:hypothetical protein
MKQKRVARYQIELIGEDAGADYVPVGEGKPENGFIKAAVTIGMQRYRLLLIPQYRAAADEDAP